MPFKDIFSKGIHKNNALSNAQKMQYLKSKLKGEAERMIQHLPISADNYNICWEILNHRFHHKRIIFIAHANMFLNILSIQQQSFSAFKKMRDATTLSTFSNNKVRCKLPKRLLPVASLGRRVGDRSRDVESTERTLLPIL